MQATVMQLPNIKTQDNIIKIIEDFVVQKQCSYMDAILEYCRINDADIIHIGELIKKNDKLKQKIKAEASSLHMMKHK